MSEPRKNYGRHNVSRGETGRSEREQMRERIDLILKFDGNIQGPQIRARLVDKIEALLASPSPQPREEG